MESKPLDTIECINGKQMPRWDFAHAWDESESAHFAHAGRHPFIRGGPFSFVLLENLPLGYLELQISGSIRVMFFLFLQENIFCGYSLEVLQWGTSNEYPQYMFLWRNKKNSSTLNLVEKSVLSEAVIHYMTLHIIFKDTYLWFQCFEILRGLCTLEKFSAILWKWEYLWLPVCFSTHEAQSGFTLKWKNLLQQGTFLYFF